MVTGLQDYAVASAAAEPEARGRVLGGSSFAVYRRRAASAGLSYVQGSYSFATPAGVTTKPTYEALRDSLLDELHAAMPLDAVLLTLHGAMIADGYEDCETDVVSKTREIVGRDATIGVLLDPHCDLPDQLVDLADVIVCFKEYPHVDIDQRADELAEIVISTVAGRTRPGMAIFDCRMVGMYPTTATAMRAFVSRMKIAEQQPGILSVSLAHGFPWGDSPAAGTRLLVVADGAPARAEELAIELGRQFFAIRHEVSLRAEPLAAALDRALSHRNSTKPVVIADVADNAGGGAPSDSTFILRELLERDVNDAAMALIWDPAVVETAFKAGEGADLTVRLGGKMGPFSGDPLDLTMHVHGLVEELVQRWPQEDGYAEVPCGPCACLSTGGVEVVVGSVRQQAFGIELFTAFGIDPTARQLLVVKSMNHFRAAFAPIAREVIYANTPGALNLDPTTLPYRFVDTRKFPWLDDPWAKEA